MFTHIQNPSDSITHTHTHTHTHTGRAKESERLAMCLPWDPPYSPAVGDQWSVRSLSLEQPEAHSSLVQSCVSQRGRAVSLGKLAHATFYYRGLSPWHKHPLSPVGWPRPTSFRCRALGFTVSFAFLPTSWSQEKLAVHQKHISCYLGASHHTVLKSTWEIKGRSPQLWGTGEGSRDRGEGGGQGKKEGRKLEDLTRGGRVDLYSFISSKTLYGSLPSWHLG